jgi:hypothetical protein
MDCYHDILGTTPNSSEQEIKRQYKLLSNRVHPDKGGNPALMLLINRAYEKVLSGSGVQDVYSSSSADAETVIQSQSMHKMIAKLKQENSKLQQENQHYTKQQQKLNQANEALMKTRISLAEAEKQILAFKNRQSPRYQLSDKKSHSLRSIAIAVLFITIMALSAGYMSYHKVEWNVVEWMQSLINHTPKPTVTEKAVETEQHTEPAKIDHPPLLKSESEAPKEIHHILPSQMAGQWQLRYYFNTFIPYIAIKNEQGSMVVRDCSGDFNFYLNHETRPLRVAANLEYLRQEGEWFVYHILYGNGASTEGWQNAKLLRFAEDSFTNAQFVEALKQLQQQCAAMPAEL